MQYCTLSFTIKNIFYIVTCSLLIRSCKRGKIMQCNVLATFQKQVSKVINRNTTQYKNVISTFFMFTISWDRFLKSLFKFCQMKIFNHNSFNEKTGVSVLTQIYFKNICSFPFLVSAGRKKKERKGQKRGTKIKVYSWPVSVTTLSTVHSL